LADGAEALARMLDMIARAERWVHFENYIIRDDATGRSFADALVRAVRRGVHATVLYDAFGCRGTGRGFWRGLRQAGVRVVAFNPPNPLRPLASLKRNHRKYVAIDGAEAVLGGICIGDEWAGTQSAETAWRDTAVAISGSAVPALELGFARMWAAGGGTPSGYSIPTQVAPRGEAGVRIVEGLPGRLRLYRAMELLVATATQRIWITDAYLVPATPLFRTIMAAAQEGVDVRVLVPGATDIPAVRALTRVGYRELLECGVRIWEWHGPMLHAKTVIVDDAWYKVGSSNLNPSSFLSNYELDVLIEDRAMTSVAVQQFRRDLAGAVEIVLRRRRVAEALAIPMPPAVVPAEPHGPQAGSATGRRDLGIRAVVALRQVAWGAQRSITGALLFLSLGGGLLLVALPTVMSYLLAGVSFTLAAAAVWRFLQLRRARFD
jgi:cardiolipin synthase